MFTKCPSCEGTIHNSVGYCEDCGLNLAEYCNEMDAWLDFMDTLPPPDVYEEAA